MKLSITTTLFLSAALVSAEVPQCKLAELQKKYGSLLPQLITCGAQSGLQITALRESLDANLYDKICAAPACSALLTLNDVPECQFNGVHIGNFFRNVQSACAERAQGPATEPEQPKTPEQPAQQPEPEQPREPEQPAQQPEPVLPEEPMVDDEIDFDADFNDSEDVAPVVPAVPEQPTAPEQPTPSQDNGADAPACNIAELQTQFGDLVPQLLSCSAESGLQVTSLRAVLSAELYDNICAAQSCAALLNLEVVPECQFNGVHIGDFFRNVQSECQARDGSSPVVTDTTTDKTDSAATVTKTKKSPVVKPAAAAAKSTTDAPVCDLAELQKKYSSLLPDLMKCGKESGLQITSLKESLDANLYDKICAAPACASLLTLDDVPECQFNGVHVGNFFRNVQSACDERGDAPVTKDNATTGSKNTSSTIATDSDDSTDDKTKTKEKETSEKKLAESETKPVAAPKSNGKEKTEEPDSSAMTLSGAITAVVSVVVAAMLL